MPLNIPKLHGNYTTIIPTRHVHATFTPRSPCLLLNFTQLNM